MELKLRDTADTDFPHFKICKPHCLILSVNMFLVSAVTAFSDIESLYWKWMCNGMDEIWPVYEILICANTNLVYGIETSHFKSGWFVVKLLLTLKAITQQPDLSSSGSYGSS